jgi:hypothetical protein
MQKYSIYTQKAKTLGIVVEFPNRMSTVRSMLDQFVLLFDLHIIQIMYASSRHIRYNIYEVKLFYYRRSTLVQRPNIEYTRFITSMGRYRCLIIIIPEVYHPLSSQRIIH